MILDGQGQPNPLSLTLRTWLFDEMVRGEASIRELALKLAQLPSGQAGKTAGAPFELPYTLALPDHGPERWRLHLDLIRATESVVAAIRAAGENDPLLEALLERDGKTDNDERRKTVIANLNSPE